MTSMQIGVDLAKSVFEVAVSTIPGRGRERRRLSRDVARYRDGNKTDRTESPWPTSWPASVGGCGAISAPLNGEKHAKEGSTSSELHQRSRRWRPV